MHEADLDPARKQGEKIASAFDSIKEVDLFVMHLEAPPQFPFGIVNQRRVERLEVAIQCIAATLQPAGLEIINDLMDPRGLNIFAAFDLDRSREPDTHARMAGQNHEQDELNEINPDPALVVDDQQVSAIGYHGALDLNAVIRMIAVVTRTAMFGGSLLGFSAEWFSGLSVGCFSCLCFDRRVRLPFVWPWLFHEGAVLSPSTDWV